MRLFKTREIMYHHHNFKYLVWTQNGFMMKIKTQENQFRKNFLGKLKIFFVLDLSILKWHNHKNESLNHVYISNIH